MSASWCYNSVVKYASSPASLTQFLAAAVLRHHPDATGSASMRNIDAAATWLLQSTDNSKSRRFGVWTKHGNFGCQSSQAEEAATCSGPVWFHGTSLRDAGLWEGLLSPDCVFPASLHALDIYGSGVHFTPSLEHAFQFASCTSPTLSSCVGSSVDVSSLRPMDVPPLGSSHTVLLCRLRRPLHELRIVNIFEDAASARVLDACGGRWSLAYERLEAQSATPAHRMDGYRDVGPDGTTAVWCLRGQHWPRSSETRHVLLPCNGAEVDRKPLTQTQSDVISLRNIIDVVAVLEMEASC